MLGEGRKNPASLCKKILVTVTHEEQCWTLASVGFTGDSDLGVSTAHLCQIHAYTKDRHVENYLKYHCDIFYLILSIQIYLSHADIKD